jgi:outer membrane protein insertion porin family
LELTVPTFLPEQYGIKAALFSDVGTPACWTTSTGNHPPSTAWCPQTPPTGCQGTTCIKDDLSLRASAGLSIFWRSPMGPIRFDFSQFWPKKTTTETETFRFSTSTRF